VASGIASSKAKVGHTLREDMGFWWWIAKIVYVYWIVWHIKVKNERNCVQLKIHQSKQLTTVSTI